MDRKSQTAVELNLSISWTKLTEYSFIFPNGDSKVKVSFTYDQNHNLAYLIGSVVLTGDYNISQWKYTTNSQHDIMLVIFLEDK